MSNRDSAHIQRHSQGQITQGLQSDGPYWIAQAVAQNGTVQAGAGAGHWVELP